MIRPAATLTHTRPALPSQQKGAVLGVALIFLVLITILAMAASASSTLQLRMAGNLRNAQQAELSANTALRGVEWALWSNANIIGKPFICTDGGLSNEDACIQYNPFAAAYGDGGVVTEFKNSGNWVETGAEYLGPGNLDYTSTDRDTARLAKNPRYIVEDMGLVRAPGAGSQLESGATGPQSGAMGTVRIHTYRITARATGGGESSIRVRQSTFDAQPSN